MKRAEEAALKVCPVIIEEHTESDINKPKRLFHIKGYEQAEKETIDRACKWLFSHLPILVDYYNEDIHEKADKSEFIKLFRTQMEEKQ